MILNLKQPSYPTQPNQLVIVMEWLELVETGELVVLVQWIGCGAEADVLV